MVILIGIVDNDAVVKIDFINQMRREGMTTRDAILEAGRARLRPIVMNTITTMLAITPMMLGLGRAPACRRRSPSPCSAACSRHGAHAHRHSGRVRADRRLACASPPRAARGERRAAWPAPAQPLISGTAPVQRSGREPTDDRAFIRRPIAVSMMYLVVAALGVAAFRNIPIELLPDTSLPRLTVTASWTGTSPEVVEAFLTAPLESAIQQVRGVERITSTSREGAQRSSVEFARDTDMDFARLELSERLASSRTSCPSAPPRPA
jgi:multidrug efflux pump subunit AcrB